MPINVHTRRNSKPRKLKVVRVDRLEIRNQTDSLYYTVQCKSMNGIPVLYLVDTGKN